MRHKEALHVMLLLLCFPNKLKNSDIFIQNIVSRSFWLQNGTKYTYLFKITPVWGFGGKECLD